MKAVRSIAALGCAVLLMACPGPISSIPPPTPIGVEFAVNAAIQAEHEARARCPSGPVQWAAVAAARFTWDSRYRLYATSDQLARVDEARRDTDRCDDP